MRRLYLPLMFCAVFLSVVSTPARADFSWDWFDYLSGPGPWVGPNIQARVYCSGVSFGDCMADHAAAKTLVLVDIGHQRTQPSDQHFSMVNSEVKIMRRLLPMLDVGAGIGFLHFYGDGLAPFTDTPLIPVSVSVSPLAWADPRLRVFKVSFDELYITNGFKGAGWNTGGEFRPRLGVGVDLQAIGAMLLK